MAASRLGQAREAALQAEAVVASNRELQQEATIEAGFPVSVIEAIIMSGPMLTAEAASLREALEEAKIVTKKAEDKVAAALELQQEIMEALAEIMEAVAEGRGRRPGAAASSSAAAAAEEPEGVVLRSRSAVLRERGGESGGGAAPAARRVFVSNAARSDGTAATPV